MDVAAGDRHLEDIGAKAPAAAFVARHVHVRHEHHLDLEIASAFALLAAAAGDVEAERAGRVAPLACERRVREDAAHFVECLDVCHGIRARRLADGALVDAYDVVERIVPGELGVRADAFSEVLLRGVFAVESRLQRS
ncbi:MAG TPA: hypothetical protein VJ867_07225 [Gemmatimonadaceae bacterium]|nr:hypothetical protein [Gemmatimonadaceae bacterium]